MSTVNSICQASLLMIDWQYLLMFVTENNKILRFDAGAKSGGVLEVQVRCSLRVMTPEAISYWLDKFRDDLIYHRFTKEFVIKGLDIILTLNYFLFDGKFYLQIRGTATSEPQSHFNCK